MCWWKALTRGRSIPIDRWARDSHEDLRSAIQEGLLGGAGMAAAMAPAQDLTLRGMEDPELYRKNLLAFDGVRQETERSR